MDVVVGIISWEQACCGSAIERNQIVDLQCARVMGEGGRTRLVEAGHDTAIEERVRGRVTDIEVVLGGGATRPVLRLPGGDALRGSDPEDDGHLEDPWTGDEITEEGGDYLVTVRTSG